MSEVEQMIAELESARQQYASDRFFEDAKTGLIYESTNVIKSLKPVIGSLLPQNQTPLKERADRISGDTDIADDEIPAAFQRVVSAMEGQVHAACDIVERAKDEALKELEKSSNPWANALDERYFRDFLLELNALGGAPKTKDGIIEEASEALKSENRGAIQFWWRNFVKLYQRAINQKPEPGKSAPNIEFYSREYARIATELDAARTKMMSTLERDKAKTAEKIRQTWKDENMAELLEIARATAIPGSNISSASLPQIRPRTRTFDEQRLAAAKKEIRNVQRGKQ
jgi:hypothetical protein